MPLKNVLPVCQLSLFAVMYVSSHCLQVYAAERHSSNFMAGMHRADSHSSSEHSRMPCVCFPFSFSFAPIPLISMPLSLYDSSVNCGESVLFLVSRRRRRHCHCSCKPRQFFHALAVTCCFYWTRSVYTDLCVEIYILTHTDVVC